MSPAGPGKRSGCHHALAVADPMPAGLHIMAPAGSVRTGRYSEKVLPTPKRKGTISTVNIGSVWRGRPQERMMRG